MRLKLYCNRYTHFKDALVCSVNCVYRTRCHDFALFYDEHRAEVESLVADYYAARNVQEGQKAATPAPLLRVVVPAQPAAVARPEELRKLIRLEVLREMADSVFIWIDKEDRAELLETAEVLRRAERGQKAKHIYKVSQEMELRFQLVPRKRIEKAKRVAAEENERAEARRTRRAAARPAAPAPVPFPAPVAAEERPDYEAPAPRRRARSR
jgi:pyruvate/2-oxoglutarate dehydrogenase complex dihydrolipoamide acyltransferase (E2) component